MTPADIFRAMADRIERSDAKEFAGAAVVVPPGSEDAAIALLMVDPDQNLLQFYSTLKSRVEIATTAAMQEEQRKQDAQGRFGR